jgi:hypothetical protein
LPHKRWFRNDPQDNLGRRPHACSAPGRLVKNIGHALEHTTRLFSDCENSGYFKVLFPPNRMLERTGTTLSFILGEKKPPAINESTEGSH